MHLQMCKCKHTCVRAHGRWWRQQVALNPHWCCRSGESDTCQTGETVPASRRVDSCLRRYPSWQQRSHQVRHNTENSCFHSFYWQIKFCLRGKTKICYGVEDEVWRFLWTLWINNLCHISLFRYKMPRQVACPLQDMNPHFYFFISQIYWYWIKYLMLNDLNAACKIKIAKFIYSIDKTCCHRHAPYDVTGQTLGDGY